VFRRHARSAVIAVLATAGALLVVAAPNGGAQAAGGERLDPRDVAGPLDLDSASLQQRGAELALRIHTRGQWRPRDLDAAPGRSLCLNLFARTGSAPRASLCVTGRPRSARAALRLSRLTPAGGVIFTRTLTAGVHRPDGSTLVATFAPRDAAVAVGPFRWQVSSSWTRAPRCPVAGTPAASACRDLLPDRGTVAAVLAPPTPIGCAIRGRDYRTGGSGHRKLVALTFDDGPSSYTSEILRELERARAHATFFVIGRQVAGEAAEVRRELADGNAVGNHTYAHPNVSGGGSFAADQLRRTSRAIRSAAGYTPCVFRAPYGAVSGALFSVARGQGMLTIGWNVDPMDWARPGADAIYARVVGAVQRESIVIMHDGGGPRNQTVAALPRIIATLRARGYRLVTVPELLGLRPRYA
jgi:peptidoglycan/xylan/chitin deacetylase (PgdA/CDA1 family)